MHPTQIHNPTLVASTKSCFPKQQACQPVVVKITALTPYCVKQGPC